MTNEPEPRPLKWELYQVMMAILRLYKLVTSTLNLVFVNHVMMLMPKNALLIVLCANILFMLLAEMQMGIEKEMILYASVLFSTHILQ